MQASDGVFQVSANPPRPYINFARFRPRSPRTNSAKMAPKKKAAPCPGLAPGLALPKEMLSGGTSKVTKQAKANQHAKGDAFLKYIKENDADLSARWGSEWASVPEEELTQEGIWGHFASFLADVYVIPKGERNQGEMLKIKTAHGMWGGLIFQARGKLAKSTRQETKVCLLARFCHAD